MRHSNKPRLLSWLVFTFHSPFSLPPPSRARARRRWCFAGFRPCSRSRPLPRMQQRDGGRLSHGFDPVESPATSLACNSETEVAFAAVSTPLGPPPINHAKSMTTGCGRPQTTPHRRRRPCYVDFEDPATLTSKTTPRRRRRAHQVDFKAHATLTSKTPPR